MGIVCAWGPSAMRTSTWNSSMAGYRNSSSAGQPMDFVDEQDVPGLEGREQADQVAGALEHGSRGGADVHAELARHEQRERRLPEPRRSEEQRVVERLLALLRRVDGDLERLLDLGLADELVQARGAQRRVRDALVGERLRRGDLNPLLRHSITLTPPACCSRAARATEPAGGPPPGRGVCDR